MLFISFNVEHTVIPLPRLEFSPGLTIQMLLGIILSAFFYPFFFELSGSCNGVRLSRVFVIVD